MFEKKIFEANVMQSEYKIDKYVRAQRPGAH